MKSIFLFTTFLLTSFGLLFSQNNRISLFANSQAFIDDHDPNNCIVVTPVNGFIAVSNSTVNDTLKIIDNSGSEIHWEKNINGDTYWNPNYTLMDMAYIPDQIMSGGYGNPFTGPFMNIYKIICGPDTLYGPTYTVDYDPGLQSVLCTYSTISGKFYIDNDADCSFSAGDTPIQGIYPKVTTQYSFGSPSTSMSASGQGDYSINLQEDHFLSATVSVSNTYQFAYLPNPCSPFSYIATSLPQTNFDFALLCNDLDVRVDMAGGRARPLIPFQLNPRVLNMGCEAVAGVLKLKLDANVIYDAGNSIHPADNVDGDTLFWNYSNLNNLYNNTLYINQFIGSIHLTPDATLNIGDTMKFEIWADIPSNDANPANNYKLIRIPIVNSFDPNMKEVEPKGMGEEGFIPATTEKLTYTIHFQNTGNAEALVVNIIDTLDFNTLIPNTLKLINASHKVEPEWLDGNVIRFHFPGINLPDSTSDQAGSQGFVKFEIEIRAGLEPGTEILNKAEIFFDSNEEIITNFALNTIEIPGSLMVTEEDLISNVKIYPNPAHDKINVYSSVRIQELEVFDLTGKSVYTKTVRGEQTQFIIPTTQLESGVYFIQWKDQHNNRESRKVIIQ